MGIDGIGKAGGAGAPPVVDLPATSGSPLGETFHMASGAVASPTAGTDALQRLQAGELGLDQYLDLEVDAATAHLGALPAADLDFIRATLRDQLESDPVLVELVRQATGTSADLAK